MNRDLISKRRERLTSLRLRNVPEQYHGKIKTLLRNRDPEIQEQGKELARMFRS